MAKGDWLDIGSLEIRIADEGETWKWYVLNIFERARLRDFINQHPEVRDKILDLRPQHNTEVK